MTMNEHLPGDGPAPGWPGDGSGLPGQAGEPAGGPPVAAPRRPASRRRLAPSRRAGVAAAAAVVVASAGAVAVLAVAVGGSLVSVLLLVAVAGVAVAELMTRTGGGRPPGGPASRPPLTLLRGPAGSRARTAAIAGVVSVAVIGTITGIFSWLAVLESDRCISTRCDNVIGAGWLVLMVSQILIFWTALLGAVYARGPGQLARAVLLGLAGPFAALVAFGVAATGVPG
jgi:hypothetical protein